MVDVVTPRKRLTEPTVGGDPNTWGGLLNTDFDLIDTALGGTLVLAITGNTGIDSVQGQNTGYVFTGTLAATATITWASYYGLAIISNQTTGGRTIVCGLAGQSVSVLPGETAGIWSTGTDFLRFGGGSSSSSATFTIGGVVFGGTAGLTQDTSNFFWDATNHRLGLGTNGPVYGLDVNSSNTRLSANAADVLLRLENNTGTGRRWALSVSGTGSTNPAGTLCVQDVTANATRAIFDASGNFTISAGGSVISPIVNVTNQFQVNGSALSAGNLSNGTTGSGAVVLAITPGLSDGTRIGSAAGNVSTPTTLNTNILLYNNSPTNWSGVGSDVGGNFYITTGTSGVQTRFSMSTLGAIRLWNYGFGALSSDASGNLSSGTLAVSVGGTGTTQSTGSGSVVLSNNPLLTGLVGIGGTGSSNWRTTIQGLGTTSATFPLVITNSIGVGCFYVRDDAFVFLPQYGNGALSVSGGAIVSGTLAVGLGGTGTTTSTGTGSNVLSTSPTFSGNIGFGQASASNWRSYFHGIGTTSATYSIVAQNANSSGLLYVRDDGVVAFPAYAPGFLQTDSGGNISPLGATGTGVVALNVNPNLSVVAAGSTAFASLAFRFGLALYPSDFGAVGDGSTDDSVALQNWLIAGAANHIELRMAARTYATTSGLGLNNPNGLTIRGAGANSSVILYIGSDTTADIFGIGGATQTIGITLSDFRIASNRTMTTSSGLHLFNVCRSHLDNIILDGQDGNGNLSTGFYFDQVDAVWLKGYEARGQIHGILVSGTVGNGPKAGLYITHGKIASCLYGLRCGGAFGGLQIDESDIIVNTYGILIDQGAKAEANREIFIGQNCSVDSSINDNIYVNDAGGGTLSMHNWNASAGQNGLNVVSWAGKIEIAGGPYFNNAGNGMVFQDTRSTVHISDGVQIHDNGGWGITSTVFTDIFYEGGLDNLGNALGMVNISSIHLRRPCTQGTVTIVNGGGFELPQRSGIISVSSLHSGDTGVYVLGGGGAVLIGTSQGSFVNGFPGGGQNSVRWDGGAYQIVNESGVDVTFQWAMVSSRYAN